jgi:PAS domain-containing protein
MSEQFAEVSQRQEELERLLANAGVGLNWLTPTGGILWANQTELDRLDYSTNEYIGHHIGEFYQDPHKVQEMLGRLSRGEVLRNFEISVLRKDGRVRHLLINSDSAGWRSRIHAMFHSGCDRSSQCGARATPK